MKHFQQIASGIDVAPLRAQLAAHPELWDVHKNRMAGANSPFTGTSDIWVRYNDLARARPDFAGFSDEHVPIWYPAWDALPALRPLVFNLMADVRGEMLGGVLITKIPAGGRLGPHVDRGWHVEYYDKFYISVDSASGAFFCCRDENGHEERLNPEVGDCWLFDNRKLHWVVNDSGKARVTLIVCIRTERFGRVSCRLPGPQVSPPPER